MWLIFPLKSSWTYRCCLTTTLNLLDNLQLFLLLLFLFFLKVGTFTCRNCCIDWHNNNSRLMVFKRLCTSTCRRWMRTLAALDSLSEHIGDLFLDTCMLLAKLSCLLHLQFQRVQICCKCWWKERCLGDQGLGMRLKLQVTFRFLEAWVLSIEVC